MEKEYPLKIELKVYKKEFIIFYIYSIGNTHQMKKVLTNINIFQSCKTWYKIDIGIK